MITGFGKTQVRRYFAGQTGIIGGALAVGILNTAATVNDTKLSYEIARVPVTSIGSDLANNRIIFKGTLPAELKASIYEIGLFSDIGTNLSKFVFDISGDEVWSAGVVGETNSRSGNSLRLSPAASGTVTSTFELNANLSQFSGSDTFALAGFADSNLASLQIIMKDSAGNQAYKSLVPAAGYNVTGWTKGSMTVTGPLDWSDIAVIDISVTSKATATVFDLDGLRIETTENLNPLYGLVARGVVTATTKSAGVPTDIEYALEITV